MPGIVVPAVALIVQHWYAIAALATLLLLGFVEIRHNPWRVEQRRMFTDQYRQRFVDFVTSPPVPFNQQDYDWLTRRLAAMERELGPAGRALYKPPMALAYLNNLPILSNTLLAVATRQADAQAVSQCEYLLNAHAGSLETYIQEHRNDRRNPVRWFLEGVEVVLSIPLTLLQWAGVFGPATAAGIRRGIWFRLAGLMVGLAAFVSALIVIVTGWDTFVKQLEFWAGLRR